MKKIFFGILLSCLVFNSAFAQKGRHEIKAGYGVGTSNEFINSLSDMQITDVTKNITSGDKTFKGAFQLGYKYSLTDKINIGAGFAYERAAANAHDNMNNLGKLKSDYYTIAAEMDYVYLRREGFTFYSTAGLGATIYDQKYTSEVSSKDTDNKVNLNFQVTPIGVKYGDKFGFFGEIGYGYKGIFNFGIFTSF